MWRPPIPHLAIDMATEGDELESLLSGTVPFQFLGVVALFVATVAVGFRYVRRLGDHL